MQKEQYIVDEARPAGVGVPQDCFSTIVFVDGCQVLLHIDREFGDEPAGDRFYLHGITVVDGMMTTFDLSPSVEEPTTPEASLKCAIADMEKLKSNPDSVRSLLETVVQSARSSRARCREDALRKMVKEQPPEVVH